MELIKGVELAYQEFGTYIGFCIDTLTKPSSIALSQRAKRKLSAPEILYAALSLTAATLTLSIFAEELSPSRLSLSIFLSILWLLIIGSVIHSICRLLRGDGAYVKTLSIHLRISSVIWLLSSFLALIVVSTLSISHRNIFSVCCVISGFLALFYLPVSLGRLHGFGIGRQISLGLILLFVLTFTTFISGAILLATSRVYVPNAIQ